MKNVGAIILAGGKGKRMRSKKVNKVVLPLGGKPMILSTVEFVRSLGIETILVVVGFAKESVQAILKNSVLYAVQKKQLGTAHAVSTALSVLPKSIEQVLVINGDDAVFYREENLPLVKTLVQKHVTWHPSITILTVKLENPFGIGRIIRDKNDKILKIVEEKDATDVQRQIKEVYSGCGIMSVLFLKKYLPKIKKSSVTGEYYLVSLIELAVLAGEKVEVLEGGKIPWRGVNTPAELAQAKKLYLQKN